MNRREFITLLGAAVPWPLAVRNAAAGDAGSGSSAAPQLLSLALVEYGAAALR
jgi:hypothetical protein